MRPSAGFTDEARENLAALEQGVLALEAPDGTGEGEHAELVAALFRAAHNLKGMAAMEELDELATVAHRMETVLDHHRHGGGRPDAATVDVLLAACDLVGALIDAADADAAAPSSEAILARLDATIAAQSGSPDRSAPGPSAPGPSAPSSAGGSDDPWPDGAAGGIRVVLDAAARLPKARAMVVIRRVGTVAEVLATIPDPDGLATGDRRDLTVVVAGCDDPDGLAAAVAGLPDVAEATWVTPPTPAPAPDGPAAPPALPATDHVVAPTTTIRVDVDRLDELSDAVGELVVNRNRLAQEVARTGDLELATALRRVNRTLADLQLSVMRVRLVSLESTVERARRLTRDVARDLGKEVHLEVEGAETEVDRSIVDEVVTPLVHLLRNAIDHGLEDPDTRRAAGKPPAGRLGLRAYHQGSQVVVEVSDDGAGIDVDRVAAKAERLGLLRPGDRPTRDEVVQLMFTPGFSTREEVSAVSGRGVGLDVVRSQVSALGGDIDVVTRAGEGTTFRLRLPLSLAVIEALLVQVADQTWAVPLDAAVETARLGHLVGGVGAAPRAARHRGALVAAIDGRRTLAGAPPTDGTEHHVAVLFDDLGTRFALVVDDLLGSREIVVKPPPARLAGLDHLAGVTVLPDGSVGGIADLPVLARRWRAENPRSAGIVGAGDREPPAGAAGLAAALPAGLRRAADALGSLVGAPVDLSSSRWESAGAGAVLLAVPLHGDLAGEVGLAVSGHAVVLRVQGVDERWHADAVVEWANVLASQFAVGVSDALSGDVRAGLPEVVAEGSGRPGDDGRSAFAATLRAGPAVVRIHARLDAPATPR